MNEALIQNWNSRVEPHDSIYFLGDFSFGTYDDTCDVLGRLNGFKHLIKGNHDHYGRHSKRNAPFPWETWFVEVTDYKRLKTDVGKFVLCHFPFASWERGYINLHGHTHGKFPSYYGQHDVGVDANNYFPISAIEARDLALDKNKPKAAYL